MGSSYDNAAAEALNKSYECEDRLDPWKGRDDLKAATTSSASAYSQSDATSSPLAEQNRTSGM